MMTSCCLILLLLLITPATSQQINIPDRFAIYYGYPSLINGANGNVDKAVKAFAKYSLVILGDGVEFSDTVAERMPPGVGPVEHALAKQIISKLQARGTKVYGYIAIGNTQRLSSDEIERRIKLWADMGIYGVFLDEAGYDYGVTRQRQNSAIDFAHKLGLSVFINAFNPDDVFSSQPVPFNAVGGGNPIGLPTLLGKNDLYMLESFQIVQGNYEDPALWMARATKATGYKSRYGTKLMAVATSGQMFAQTLLEYAWWGALLWGLDGFAWGEPDYGTSSNLPFRRVKALSADIGTNYLSSVITQEGVYIRYTNKGKIFVDTLRYKAGFLSQ
ncbi:MAG: hypothetical protein RMM17_12640 [Acidobacteriota bacterium]|nr:hypothetical protein [Blastocatellia bacterium]MDW8413518.1 hypothetical protein [Acidobacteriota bacterium]